MSQHIKISDVLQSDTLPGLLSEGGSSSVTEQLDLCLHPRQHGEVEHLIVMVEVGN